MPTVWCAETVSVFAITIVCLKELNVAVFADVFLLVATAATHQKTAKTTSGVARLHAASSGVNGKWRHDNPKLLDEQIDYPRNSLIHEGRVL